jgi:hypothetical protein
MATSYADGFSYVKGPFETFVSVISSTATFRKGAPLTFSDDRTLIEADSDTTALVGIALHDAANSVYAGKALVQKILPNTVFATKIETDATASILSAGQSYNIEKSGNNLRLDVDSQASPRVTIVPREDGTTVLSNDSSVWVTFLQDFVGLYASNASVQIFAQE